jgi:GntR family transcriptional regulator
MKRLHLIDKLPVILERYYVVAAHCPDPTPTSVSGSLYDAWRERYRLAMAGGDERIRAVNIRGGDARARQVRDGAAGMLGESVGYLVCYRPLWFERTLCRADAYEFHNWIGSIQPAGLAKDKFLKTGERPI